MDLPWHNSASEMFVNLNIELFCVMPLCFYTIFVQGLRYLGNENGSAAFQVEYLVAY